MGFFSNAQWKLTLQSVVESDLCLSLNVFIANIKQGVAPQVLPTLVTALPLQSTYITLNSDIYTKFYDRINF